MYSTVRRIFIKPIRLKNKSSQVSIHLAVTKPNFLRQGRKDGPDCLHVEPRMFSPSLVTFYAKRETEQLTYSAFLVMI